MRPLTWLTAEPALRLLLGEAGFVSADFPFREAWAVFTTYLRWPASLSDDASFQVSREASEDDAPVTVSFIRQLTQDDEGWQKVVVLAFTYDPNMLPIEVCELWCSDYTTLADFVAAVEARPEFQEAAVMPITVSGLYQEDSRTSDAG
jgi:hypothetical protein